MLIKNTSEATLCASANNRDNMAQTIDKSPKNFNGNVVAVVVTYNRKQLLKECVQALIDQSSKPLKVLIIDNASTDGTYEQISDLIDGDNVLYKNTGENIGGAGGFNFGIKEAVKLGCDYVWLMDDDCIVRSDALSELIAYAEHINGDFGFLSSAVLWSDGSICNMTVQRKSIMRSVTDFSSEGQKVMLASFVSLFLNVKAIEKCGLPIKEFFIWGDDWEYTSRISKEYANYFVPKSVAVHKSSSNIGVNIVDDGGDRLDRYFFAYRNEKYLFDKLGIKGRLYFFLKICYHCLRILLSNTQHKKDKLQIIKKGLKAAKSFKPQIEYLN